LGKLVGRWAASALGLFLTGWVLGLPGIQFQEWSTTLLPDTTLPAWSAILLAALVLAIVNTFIRPLVMVFTCLINFLTLGLFTLVVNAAMLWLTSWAMDRWLEAGFIAPSMEGVVAALAATVIIATLNFIITRIFL
jgi:putative membrane protein